jgi:hypothetical protein
MTEEQPKRVDELELSNYYTRKHNFSKQKIQAKTE